MNHVDLAHSRTGGDTGAMGRLPMLAPPLAPLLFPFALEGFHTSVAHIVALGASTLSWLSAAARLALAFAMPLIAMLAAMYFSEIVVRLWRNCLQSVRPCLPLRRQPCSSSSASFLTC